MRTPKPAKPASVAASLLTALLLSAAGPAAGESVEYLIEGNIGTIAVPSPLDNGTFALRLSFDEPTTPDPDLSDSVFGQTGFRADAWTLDLFAENGGSADRLSSDDRPDSLGYAVFTGELTGFNSAVTFIDLGVDDPLGQPLIRTTFSADSLVAPQFTNDLADLTPDLQYLGGGVLDEAADESIELLFASLAPQRLDDDTPDDAVPGSVAKVVPSPTAVAGGLMLMLGLLARRRRETV